MSFFNSTLRRAMDGPFGARKMGRSPFYWSAAGVQWTQLVLDAPVSEHLQDVPFELKNGLGPSTDEPRKPRQAFLKAHECTSTRALSLVHVGGGVNGLLRTFSYCTKAGGLMAWTFRSASTLQNRNAKSEDVQA